MSAAMHMPRTGRLWRFIYPHAGGWSVVYLIPGTKVLHVECVCRSFDTAIVEAARLNGR